MAAFLSLVIYMGMELILMEVPSLKCMTLSGYRMQVYPVPSCPKNDTEWHKASRERGCSEKNGESHHYHCLPIHDLSQLVEFCYFGLSGPVEPELCMILSQSSFLDIRNCSMFASGCPDRIYYPTMMYQFPACLEIIGSSGCYSADPACRKVIHNDTMQTEWTKMLPIIIVGSLILAAVIFTIVKFSIYWKRIPKEQMERNGQQNSLKCEDELDESIHLLTDPKAVVADLDNSMQSVNSNTELFNVQANTKMDLQKHAADKTYIRTSAVTKAISTLKEKKIIILTGKEGEGKSIMANQVMLEMDSIPLKIRNREQWDRIVNANSSYLICLDDVIEPTSDSKKFLDHIYSCAKEGNLFAILVLSAKKFEQIKAIHPIYEPFDPEYIIDLTVKLKLTEIEKREMLKQYERGTGRKLKSASEREEILSIDTYFGFPCTCSFFFSKDEFFNQGPDFFRCTSSILYQRIDDLKGINATVMSKVCYCVLCYILVNGPVNTKQWYNLGDIESVVGVANINQSNFIDALKFMKGVYLIKTGTDGSYDFIHETVLETVLTSFGKLAPGMVIEKCRRDTLKSRVRTMSYKQRSGEIVLKISKEHYQLLANKLLLTNENKKEIVDNIIVNSTTYDFDFFKEFITHGISGLCNPSEVLRLLWDNLPREEKTVLLECMLDIYGPHVGVFSPKYDEKIHFNISLCDVDDEIENALRFCKRDKILAIVKYVSQHESLYAAASYTHKQHKSMTLLHCCVVHGWEDVVNSLLMFHEATVTEDQWSIFHFAAYAGRHTLMKNFQKRGFIYGKTAEGHSLLQCTLLGLRHDFRKRAKLYMYFDVEKKKRFPFSFEFASENDYCELIKHLHTLSDSETWRKELTMALDPENNTIKHYLKLYGYQKILKFFQDLNVIK